jgi:hypothetical protein
MRIAFLHSFEYHPLVKRLAFLLICVITGVQLLGAEKSGAPTLRGPLPLRHTHPILAPFHTAETAWLPPRRGPRISVEEYVTAANTFMLDLEYVDEGFTAIVDTETYLATAALTLRPVPRITGRLALHTLGVAGGLADPLIAGHHSLFGLPNAGREHRPENVSALYIRRDNETWVNHAGAALGLSRLDIAGRARLFTIPFSDSALSGGLQGVVSLPLSARDFVTGSGTVDLEATGILQFENFPWEVYANIGWIRYGDPPTAPLMPIAHNAYRYGITWVWSVWEIVALQVQILGQRSPLPVDHPRLGGHMSVAGFGFSLHPTEWMSWYFSFVEEFFTYAAVDTALHLGMRVEVGQ